MLKFLLFVIVAAILGFNGFLAYTNEGMNYRSAEAPGGGTLCSYYAPVRIFDVQIDAGRTCPRRILVR